MEGLSNGFGTAVDVAGSEKCDDRLAQDDCVDLGGVWEFLFVSLIEWYLEGRARDYCNESAGVRDSLFSYLYYRVHRLRKFHRDGRYSLEIKLELIHMLLVNMYAYFFQNSNIKLRT